MFDKDASGKNTSFLYFSLLILHIQKLSINSNLLIVFVYIQSFSRIEQNQEGIPIGIVEPVSSGTTNNDALRANLRAQEEAKAKAEQEKQKINDAITASADAASLGNSSGAEAAVQQEQSAREDYQQSQQVVDNTQAVTDVSQLYREEFGREPDSEGLENWVGHMQNGKSLEDIRQAFRQSPEGQVVAEERRKKEAEAVSAQAIAQIAMSPLTVGQETGGTPAVSEAAVPSPASEVFDLGLFAMSDAAQLGVTISPFPNFGHLQPEMNLGGQISDETSLFLLTDAYKLIEDLKQQYGLQ